MAAFAPQPGTVHIPTAELQVGDIVDLEFATPGWDRAKVIRIRNAGTSAQTVTLARPYMHADSVSPTAAPIEVGIEVFDIFASKTTTIRLLDRREP